MIGRAKLSFSQMGGFFIDIEKKALAVSQSLLLRADEVLE